MSAAALDAVIPSRPLWAVPTAADGRAATAWRRPSNAPRSVVVDRPQAGPRAAARVTSAEDPGCYAGITSWTTRQAWLAGVQLYLRHHTEALTTPNTRDVVSRETFMVVLAITADHADQATGRSIRACKATTAAKAGCSPTTVQRVWRIAERRLGILRLIRRARPLTFPERLAVRQGPRMPDGTRCPQRGVTALRAAHTPPWLHAWVAMATIRLDPPPVENSTARHPAPVDIAPLPRRASPEQTPHLPTTSPCGRNAVSLRSTQRTRSARRPYGCTDPATPTAPRRTRQRLQGERLAAELARRAPWAARLSPRRTAAVLADYERAGWTADTWLEAAHSVLQTLNWTMPRAGVHSPGGFIRWLTDYMTPDTPRVEPCSRPDCDGHGWITLSDGVVAKCRDCPPAVRALAGQDAVDQDADDEPPF